MRCILSSVPRWGYSVFEAPCVAGFARGSCGKSSDTTTTNIDIDIGIGIGIGNGNVGIHNTSAAPSHSCTRRHLQIENVEADSPQNGVKKLAVPRADGVRQDGAPR